MFGRETKEKRKNELLIYPSVFTQRQQYPLMPEAELRTKAEIWKQYDEKRSNLERASCWDTITKQKLVRILTCLCIFPQTACLTFHPSFSL